jgi:DNA replication protein DnaC
MNAVTYDDARLGLMLTELRLPTIGRLWPDFTQRADKEGWSATRLLGALLEHELAERVKRRIERHRIESHLDPAKTLEAFDFSMVPMVSKSHVMALATGDSWLEKGATILLFGPPGQETWCSPRYVIENQWVVDSGRLIADPRLHSFPR